MSALSSRTPSPIDGSVVLVNRGWGRGGIFLSNLEDNRFFGDPVDRYFVELPAGVIKGYFQRQSLQESRAENAGHSEEEIELNLLCVVCEYC